MKKIPLDIADKNIVKDIYHIFLKKQFNYTREDVISLSSRLRGIEITYNRHGRRLSFQSLLLSLHYQVESTYMMNSSNSLLKFYNSVIQEFNK